MTLTSEPGGKNRLDIYLRGFAPGEIENLVATVRQRVLVNVLVHTVQSGLGIVRAEFDRLQAERDSSLVEFDNQLLLPCQTVGVEPNQDRL